MARAGLLVSTCGATDAGLPSPGFDLEVLGFGCISPLAVASLFVNDEMAHPAQPVSFCGVPIRGIAPLAAAVVEGGRPDSGMVLAYLRMRRV